jgi:hypothetical protein
MGRSPALPSTRGAEQVQGLLAGLSLHADRQAIGPLIEVHKAREHPLYRCVAFESTSTPSSSPKGCRFTWAGDVPQAAFGAPDRPVLRQS